MIGLIIGLLLSIIFIYWLISRPKEYIVIVDCTKEMVLPKGAITQDINGIQYEVIKNTKLEVGNNIVRTRRIK